MSVSVSMPQLGESVTEGTVTRWLKKEGERVERDEPLLEISTDKVDTEIPSPAAGILRGITVAEDETVEVGAELALIDEDQGAAAGAPAPSEAAPSAAAPDAAAPDGAAQDGAARDGVSPGSAFPGQAPASPFQSPAPQPAASQPAQYQPPAPAQVPAQGTSPAPQQFPAQPAPYQAPPSPGAPYQGTPYQSSPFQGPGAGTPPPPAPPAQQAAPAPAAPPQAPPATPSGQPPFAADGPGTQAPSLPSGPDGPYVTPLVRKLAAEHGVNLAEVPGTGVGGRIRKQDVIEAARVRRGAAAPAQQAAAQQAAPAPGEGYADAAPAAQPLPAAAPLPRPAVVPSTLRGTTEHMSRLRQVIAQRMVESLQTSAQLTTVVEADVTEIARLRQRAKAEFEAREGVRLTFLPFFALAALEALKIHPKLNAVLDTQTAQVTYHDAEHLGVAVDTDRGLMVPVIRSAGDLNIGGLARKIADLAQRTRDGKVSPDELAGGTFTLTNTGSRGALFDTPIINQPQVAILGTGTVVKRPVVVEDPTLGEVIAVRSVIYLALTYDHRLIDGADAARFLTTVKNRLEEGAFEAELGL
jgi:2-oxoglutarate dehydrogenase E2 component (dihydrolipoamide succinyltransferase)